VLDALILPPKFFLLNGSALSISWQVRRRVHREHAKNKRIAARSFTVKKKVLIPQVELSEEGIPKAYQAYEDIFSETETYNLSDTVKTTHAINLQNENKFPYDSIYKLSESELEVLRNYLAENMEKGWIKKLIFPAGVPILFVKKPDGSLRLYVDYRALNKFIIKNRYPLFLIDETIDRLTETKVYTKLDLRDAYHRIRIKPGDEWKIAFRTRYGHYEYMVMPFGLTNAPATFQTYINEALNGYLDAFYVAYMDDICIYSDSLKEHEEYVRKVLDRLRKYGLYAKLFKCEFHKTEI
jgi:hypothetical protein